MDLRIFRDPRDYQILFLACFLLLGVWIRDFSVKPENVVAVMIGALGTQWIIDRIEKKNSQRSAWITGLSLCLLLRSNSVVIMFFAAVLSIASKLLLRYRNKHFFNPSNLGLIAAIAISGAWVTPGQWGTDVWLFFVFACSGGLVTRKVGRWDTTLAFLGIYAALECYRNFWLGWSADVYLHKMMSGSLLLFSFFMITDPRSIPDRRSARIVWAICVAALSYVLRNRFFMPTAVFWALFVLSPTTILFDRFWPAERFEWIPRNKRSPSTQEVVAS